LEDTTGKLDFVFDDDGAVNIVLDAPFLDVQPFMDAEEPQGEYQEPPMVISVTAKKLRTAPDEVIEDAKLFFDIDGQGRFNQMEMDAKVGKGGQIAARVGIFRSLAVVVADSRCLEAVVAALEVEEALKPVAAFDWQVSFR